MKKLLSLILTLVFIVGLISPAMTTTANAESGIAMTVNGTEYTDHARGWSAAIELADDTETTVKLFADWVADAQTGFVCPYGGTKDGALYVGKGNFILDLNGFKIDRNAPRDKFYSSVLYVEDCTFTLDDTSEGKTGTITGGYAQLGGGLYVEDCDFTINGGNITGNKAEKGGGVYTHNAESFMNAGNISDNDANDGGGAFVYNDDFTMNDGLIARNRSQNNGGAVYISISENILYLNGGIIEDNYSGNKGGAIYLGYGTHLRMNGGSIRNNTAISDGGAIACCGNLGGEIRKYSSLCIKGGSITGNVTQNGNGGGINWNESDNMYLADCTITGNRALKGYGGGVYYPKRGVEATFGGIVNITGNTALTDRSDNASNFFAEYESELDICQNFEVLGEINAASKIGVSFGKVNLSEKNQLTFEAPARDADLTSEMADCFFSDDTRYIVNKEEHGDHYDLYLAANPDHSFTGDPLFTVETAEEGKKDFYDRRDGWAYVIEKSKATDVKLTLLSDWIGVAGYFMYYEAGVMEGALYLPETCIKNITIDLNGFNIDRNLKERVENGSVIIMNTKGSLTLIDSSEGKTGKITGGNNTRNGGAFYVDYGTLYLKGVTVTGNYAGYGGAIYGDDLDDAVVYIQDGTKIYENTVSVSGGGIYMYNGYLYLEDGEIRDNDAANGAGIYWNSDNACYLTGGEIKGNYASDKGGGVYVSSNGDVYLGGDVQITENYYGNLYLSSGTANISNANGQDGAPNKPLTEGAKINISSANIEEEISADNSMFAEGDFRFLYSDYDRYFIRSVYDQNGVHHSHKLYINTWAHADARYPRVKAVRVNNSSLLSKAILDYDTQTITLVAYNTKKDFFKYVSLDELIYLTYDNDTYYIHEADVMSDLSNNREYKIMSDNGTYVMCTVKVVPDGGTWADEQESVDNPGKITVSIGTTTKVFTDFGEGWVYAVDQSRIQPVTVKLFEDWIAPNGSFDYSKGTDEGRLYLGDNMDITIDLNGKTISRGLTSATDNGQVFLIEDGAKLTINDSAQVGSGRITGGYNAGDGGAIYVDYGELHINGGEISGNHATGDGGAIYGTDEDDTFIYINGGKITGNTASENGGGIFMYNGYLYVDGGEISNNTATNGGGIYWESRDKLCLTGGVIKMNRANDGIGVYATDWGDIYIGGTIIIRDNYKTVNGIIVMNNFYISDTDAYLNNAAGQPEVPNKPLTEGAYVGITANGENYCMSDSDSSFTLNSVEYLKSDLDSHIIRSVYNAGGGNHTYKLYYNNYYAVTIPRVRYGEGINPYINYFYFNYDTQFIRLKFDMKYKKDGPLKSMALSELVNVSCNYTDVQIVGYNEKRDFTNSQEYMVLGSDGTYLVLTVSVEWVCLEHTDADENYICDNCGEYVLTEVAITNYDAQTNEATVFVTESGRYRLVFADYENGKLVNADMFEYDFVRGINVVSRSYSHYNLSNGDKIMLWDVENCAPICKPLTLN